MLTNAKTMGGLRSGCRPRPVASLFGWDIASLGAEYLSPKKS